MVCISSNNAALSSSASFFFRRYLTERIATHLADFSPRLHSNIRITYQFVGIPHVTYPELENELFCHNYYLRHLCDTVHFPDYEIRDPVSASVFVCWGY